MMITSVFLVASHWDTGNDRIFSGIVAVCLIVVFNLTMLKVKKVPTPWGPIPARTDAFDSLRWCINFPIDIFIVWSIDANLASVVSIWLLLTFGAMTEVYARKYKLITVGAAFISLVVIIFGIYDVEWKTEVYLIACYLSLVFTLWKLQSYISDEMQRVLVEQIERKQVEDEAKNLQRDAAIGHSTRAINHELNTLIGVANMSTFLIQSKNQSEQIDKEIHRLSKSLSYMERVSSLILDGLGSRNATKRSLSLGELYDDLKLLLCVDTDYYLKQLTFDFPEEILGCQFQERTGSTYLILHNLVKNAHEAVYEKYGRSPEGVIQLQVSVGNDDIQISVFDNGVGMSAQKIVDIQQKSELSQKPGGHGLGMKFVTSECESNGMKLTIESKLGEYSLFTLKVPKLAT